MVEKKFENIVEEKKQNVVQHVGGGKIIKTYDKCLKDGNEVLDTWCINVGLSKPPSVNTDIICNTQPCSNPSDIYYRMGADNEIILYESNPNKIKGAELLRNKSYKTIAYGEMKNLTLYDGYAYFIVWLKNYSPEEEGLNPDQMSENPGGIYLEYTKTGSCAEYISGDYFKGYGSQSSQWFSRTMLIGRCSITWF